MLRNISSAVQTVVIAGQPRTVVPDGVVSVPNETDAKRLIATAPRVWAEEQVFALPPPGG